LGIVDELLNAAGNAASADAVLGRSIERRLRDDVLLREARRIDTRHREGIGGLQPRERTI